METKKKHLSTIANDVVRQCAKNLDNTVDSFIEEFEREWKPEMGGYSRKLVEFCCSKALAVVCRTLDEKISDGSFSRFTFDMMLAWELPSSADEESYTECVAKEAEEKKISRVTSIHDDIPLFYSDLMPLLVDEEPSAGEDAFVWLGTLVPLVVDMVNGRFTFDTLTAPTGNRLHFPAYDKYLKEIHKCIKHLQKQDTPSGIEFVDDEFILHVEGTASSQRVVRHIGGTSWPGRLTLTNYALYFEASGVMSYEDSLKLDLSKDMEQNVKPVATEFPEMTSSTRRDHWLALVKEIILLHQFLSKFNVESPLEAWEMHARTILGILRLHAARELLRISPPEPKSFFIFALLDELPKGDFVLEKLAASLKEVTSGHPCSASSILRNLNAPPPCVPCLEQQKISDGNEIVQPENLASLESAINQTREIAKEVGMAKATAEGLKEEGISEKWVGLAISALLLWMVAKMLRARRNRIPEKYNKIVIRTGSDQTTMESIVSAQQGLKSIHETMQQTNIAILKIWSILVSKAPKHTNTVMTVMTCSAIVLLLIPFKFILMSFSLYGFVMTSKLGKYMQSEQGNRHKRMHICLHAQRLVLTEWLLLARAVI
ncbi:hypothetical protein ACJIZ3_021667 [Penstemon smallii]|uniref:Uncharacterized protein n=1 Tax=Penstemon smallii TaxID=265156 RepID=A0ABD3SM93_9LAMI